jgi:hypothetical protein
MIGYFKNCLTQNQKAFVTFGRQKFEEKEEQKINTSNGGNPSNGNITIETGDELSYNLTVYNVLGEKVVDLTVNNKQTINLSSLPSATYVVLINYNGSLIKTERISIVH